MRRTLITILAATISLSALAQQDVRKKLDNYFRTYRPAGQIVRSAAHLQSIEINDTLKTILVKADTHFGEQTFTPESAERIYDDIRRLLPDTCRDYQLAVKTGGWDIRDLVPTRLRQQPSPDRVWGDIDYHGAPWVSNASLPYQVTRGLQNRHLSIWASHGRYYDIKNEMWKWQRPPLFGSREDLFTQTIVVPYLIPMLEKAGAIVFTPRERDWQVNEVIVDNDTPNTSRGIYQETHGNHRWE